LENTGLPLERINEISLACLGEAVKHIIVVCKRIPCCGGAIGKQKFIGEYIQSPNRICSEGKAIIKSINQFEQFVSSPLQGL
jgi:hypothetical protein